MSFFRYGGVNVTYFLPKSSFKMGPAIHPTTQDRFSQPSVRPSGKRRSIGSFRLQFEKKALADALSLYMRALVALDESTRAKIVLLDSNDDNYDHLKIDCRAADKPYQREDYGEKLATIMKSVMVPKCAHILGQSFVFAQLSFEGYTGQITFNERGERVNYTLNVYQVTMNKLPRNVSRLQ